GRARAALGGEPDAARRRGVPGAGAAGTGANRGDDLRSLGGRDGARRSAQRADEGRRSAEAHRRPFGYLAVARATRSAADVGPTTNVSECCARYWRSSRPEAKPIVSPFFLVISSTFLSCSGVETGEMWT